MGDRTEMVKLQQSKWAAASATVQAQLMVIVGALATIIDSCQAVDDAGKPIKVSSMVYLSAISTIVLAAFTIWSRFKAEGPLSWSKPPKEQVQAIEQENKARESRGYGRLIVLVGLLFGSAVVTGLLVVTR